MSLLRYVLGWRTVRKESRADQLAASMPEGACLLQV
jgi:hypothetical protein